MGWDVIATDLEDVIRTVLAPNVSRNRAYLPPAAGAVDVRTFDWTVPPDRWVWDDPHKIATQTVENVALLEPQPPTLAPPFDLVITSDTLYSSELVTPLLRTLHGLCKSSIQSSLEAKSPQVYLCLERRDPALVERALSEARDSWGFKVERVPHKKVAKAMERGGARWEKGQWDDVEIWKLNLQT